MASSIFCIGSFGIKQYSTVYWSWYRFNKKDSDKNKAVIDVLFANTNEEGKQDAARSAAKFLRITAFNLYFSA